VAKERAGKKGKEKKRIERKSQVGKPFGLARRRSPVVGHHGCGRGIRLRALSARESRETGRNEWRLGFKGRRPARVFVLPETMLGRRIWMSG
jgi:hypothetical protein